MTVKPDAKRSIEGTIEGKQMGAPEPAFEPGLIDPCDEFDGILFAPAPFRPKLWCFLRMQRGVGGIDPRFKNEFCENGRGLRLVEAVGEAGGPEGLQQKVFRGGNTFVRGSEACRHL